MLLLSLLCLVSAPAFEIKDGDRIVMVGSSLLELEQQHGYVELMLHSIYSDKKFTVRNLAWSGDTVWGEARAEFGTQADGYKKLVEQIKAEKPTVLILGYGTNEAFAGNAGLEKFVKQYRRLLADVASPDTRFLFLTIPWPQLKKTSSHRSDHISYSAAIADLAREQKGKAQAIDLSHLYQPYDSRPLTDEGILPNDLGYQQLARIMAEAMGSNKDLSKPNEPLRQLILKKNELYFHQYRPQNDTYLFLFRKHEQGNNAAEIPQFTPLIKELDRQINELKRKK
ncbi:MAG: GDSL-type esterase/lipase family protein [Gemmatales bacterium]